MTTDAELLTRYSTQGDQSAFADLVHRHLDHVYSTALRLVNGDSHLAEDLTQEVFTDLAREAASLRECRALSGWLHTSARFAAAKCVRTEQRRRQREQATLTMNATPPNSEPEWEQLRTFLDDTIGELEGTDRDALLLRYFEKKPYAQVGAALGFSENAARMRVDRALGKLRSRLAARGITSTAAALGTALAQHVVSTAPLALGARIISQAPAAGTAGGGVAWWLSLKAAPRFAVAVAVVLMLGVAGMVLTRSTSTSPTTASAAGNEAEETTRAVSTSDLFNNGNTAPHADDERPRGLELLFVDDATELPITNQSILLRGWERGSQLLVEKAVQLEGGRCQAPFAPIPGQPYWIVASVDGYADTRLRWHPQRGEVIPQSCAVRLVRPVLLHGRVVDPSGNPVAGAEVAFGHDDLPGSDAAPQDHYIEGPATRSDEAGRWAVRHIAPDLLPHLSASASHPHYTQASLSAASEPGIAQQLIDGTFVFHLGEAAVVRGRVLDMFGQPVANALVHVGKLDEVHSREAHSSADGAFSVAGCWPVEASATAQADGFAPAAIKVMIAPGMPPVTLTLGLGKTLRVRVVDGQGQPISGAQAWYNPYESRNREAQPQVSFSGRSDARGRIIWERAPDQAMEFQFSAPGYLEVETIELRPDDEEHVITLQPALLIAGTVRDAETGELLPRFRLRIGEPERGADGSVEPRWIDLDRFAPLFTGGEFRHTVDESGAVGRANPTGFVFRFEAEGHAPKVTRFYQPEERQIWLDIRLERADETLVAVYTPEGVPASGAHVGLFARTSRLRVTPGGFATQNSSSSPPWLRRTDSKGCFLLPSDEAIHEIAIAHAEGYVETSVDEMRAARAVRLRPWARVEGIWQVAGEPVVNEELTLRRNLPETHEPRLMSLEFYAARTDSLGRFVFPQVPPASFDLRVSMRHPGGTSSRSAAQIESHSGETNQIVVSDAMAAKAR